MALNEFIDNIIFILLSAVNVLCPTIVERSQKSERSVVEGKISLCLWNLTRNKGIARPPTFRWESTGIQALSDGSVNFRAR